MQENFLILNQATHVLDQTSTILSSRKLPRCDSGLRRNTQNCTSIMGDVFERPPAQEGLSSTIFHNSLRDETWYFRYIKTKWWNEKKNRWIHWLKHLTSKAEVERYPIHLGKFLDSMEFQTRSVLINGQAGKLATAKVCVYADSVLCAGRVDNIPKDAEDRWKGQVEDLKMDSPHQDALGLCGEAIEFDWTFFPRIFVIVFSARDSARLGDEEHPTRELLGPDHLHVNVQWHFFGKRMMRIASPALEKSRIDTPIQAPHFQCMSRMLSHTAGTCFDPMIFVSVWNLGKFLDSMNFKAGRSTSELRFVYGQQIFRSLCSGSKKLTLLNQLTNLWHRDRLRGNMIFLTSICLMQWLRQPWKSFTRRSKKFLDHRFLRGRQIAYMIYEYFLARGAD